MQYKEQSGTGITRYGPKKVILQMTNELDYVCFMSILRFNYHYILKRYQPYTKSELYNTTGYQ